MKTDSPMTFQDYTLTANGEIISHRTHESSKLAPPAVKVFSEMLAAGHDFEEGIPCEGVRHIHLSWTRIDTCAVATFSVGGVPITTSFLLAGGQPEEEEQLLAAIDGFLRNMGGSPAGLAIADRPVIISVPLAAASDLGMISDMETCLAAAFFEQVNHER